LEVASVRISAIVHATEEIDRVLEALRQVFPEGTFPSKAETRKLHGHYGNEIGMINLSIHGALARSVLEHLWKGLPSLDRASILDTLDMHLDSSGGLHLRLDKQEVSRGILRLKGQDSIKIRLSFQTRVKSNLELSDGVKQLLESLESSLGNSTKLSEITG
jgi:RNA-binding protein